MFHKLYGASYLGKIYILDAYHQTENDAGEKNTCTFSTFWKSDSDMKILENQSSKFVIRLLRTVELNCFEIDGTQACRI